MTPVTIHLPDDIAAQYQQDELPRCVLEDFAVQEYARGRSRCCKYVNSWGWSRFDALHSSPTRGVLLYV